MAAGPAGSGDLPSEPTAKDGLGALAGQTRKRWPRRLLIFANVAVLVLIALAASAYGYVQWRFGQVARIHVNGLTAAGQDSQSPSGSSDPPMTILVVGSDTRSLGKAGSASFGSASEVSGQRSDTIVLVRVVPATSSVALLSVPRDLLVNVPGIGTARINAAFSGGPDLLVKTIQQDLGIDVNHFAVVNFATFTDIADALGGVYQYFPAPARDLFSNLVVPHAGCVLLKGSQALAFVRSREYQYYANGTWQYQLVPESDLARIQRQQDFIKLALKKAEQIGPTNPLALNNVISGITSSLTVDSSLSSSVMLSLALSLRHTHVSGIPNWTYPAVNSSSVPGALDPDPAQDGQTVQQFLHYGMPAHASASAATRSLPVRPSSISVQVLNGSGVAGQASEVAATLRADGFRVAGTGDATAYNFGETVIEYGPGGLTAATAVREKLDGQASPKFTNSLSGNRVVLITGHDYSAGAGHGSAPVGTSAAVAKSGQMVSNFTLAAYTASTSVPVQPSSSSYWHGQYIPPGLRPGQVPQTCPA